LPTKKTPATTTKAVAPKVIKAKPDDKELTSTTCNNCNKVKAPPRGKKLGLRSSGKRKVIKYIPLSADDGFGSSKSGIINTAGTRKEKESQMAAHRDPVEATPQIAIPAIPEVHPETSSASAASSEEDPGTTEEPPITAQDSNEGANEVPSPTTEPLPAPGSSEQDSRKRPGDAHSEEPPSKKQNVAPDATCRDQDDEEPDPPTPVVKTEPNEIIVIEDDDDDLVELKPNTTKHTGKLGAKQMQLQHKLQLLEIEKEQLRVNKEALQIKHELAVLERSENHQAGDADQD
jgi:hypothetical protein